MKPFFIFISILLLSSCQLLAPYKGPVTPTPVHWKGENPESKANDQEASEPNFEEACEKLSNWWEIFNDPILNQLEEQALPGSYTLWAALERVIEARSQAQISRSYLFPNINFNPPYSRTGSLIQNPLPGGILGNTGAPAGQCMTAASIPSLPNVFRFVQTQYLIPLTMNYEIDLWSQLSNSYFAALFHAQAASEAYFSVLLSLTADVASHYYQIRGLDTQIQVLERNIVALQRALTINQRRHRVGLVSELDSDDCAAWKRISWRLLWGFPLPYLH